MTFSWFHNTEKSNPGNFPFLFRTQCNISSYFSKNTPLNTPIVSSPMDTVTEYQMAIEMARQGGLGVIHRFMPIEDQCEQILKVKRSGVFINPVPVTIAVD